MDLIFDIMSSGTYLNNKAEIDKNHNVVCDRDYAEALMGHGFYMDTYYQLSDEMKKCYELNRTKEEIANEIKDRQVDLDSMPLPVPGLPPANPTVPTPTPAPTPPEPISLGDIIKFLIASMRERLSDEEFEEFMRSKRNVSTTSS